MDLPQFRSKGLTVTIVMDTATLMRLNPIVRKVLGTEHGNRKWTLWSRIQAA